MNALWYDHSQHCAETFSNLKRIPIAAREKQTACVRQFSDVTSFHVFVWHFVFDVFL